MADLTLNCPVCRKTFDFRSGLYGCPHANDTDGHILQKQLADGTDSSRLEADIRQRWQRFKPDGFDIFRGLMGSCQLVGGSRYRRILRDLQEKLRVHEGKSFDITPLAQPSELTAALGWKGGIWVKDETENITGSHKGRHLMGTLLYLEGLRHLGNTPEKPELAIYSCGNAALAASAVARAGGYTLHAFVPEEVEATVEEMLRDRGAVVEKIKRGETGAGDPCYIAFKNAVNRKGWVPFSCSGTDNWSNIEGGQTLGWEWALQRDELQAHVSSVFIQVGGGALASAFIQAVEEMHRLGIGRRLAKIYACQPEGGFPFVRAYYLVLKQIAVFNRIVFDLDYDRDGEPGPELEKITRFSDTGRDQIQALIEFTRKYFHMDVIQLPLGIALSQSHRFMWPWDGVPPRSLAHGILDDVTYDWYHLLRGVLMTGGEAVILKEENIRKAHRLARQHTRIKVSPTGSAGLAGLMQAIDSDRIAPDENVGLLFTGVDRG